MLINIDIITGIISSIYKGHRLKSSISYKGIFKKFSLYFIVFMGYILDYYFFKNYIENYFNVSETLNFIVLLNEIISIFENLNIFNHLYVNEFIEKIKEKIKKRG